MTREISIALSILLILTVINICLYNTNKNKQSAILNNSLTEVSHYVKNVLISKPVAQRVNETLKRSKESNAIQIQKSPSPSPSKEWPKITNTKQKQIISMKTENRRSKRYINNLKRNTAESVTNCPITRGLVVGIDLKQNEGTKCKKDKNFIQNVTQETSFLRNSNTPNQLVVTQVNDIHKSESFHLKDQGIKKNNGITMDSQARSFRNVNLEIMNLRRNRLPPSKTNNTINSPAPTAVSVVITSASLPNVTMAVVDYTAAGTEQDVFDNETDSVLTEAIERFKKLYPIELWKENGWFTEDYLKIINIHWLQFDPPRKSSHYALAGLYIIIMIAGLFGNCLVIFMFASCKSLRTPANILVVNLAVSDMLMMCKMPMFIHNSIMLGPALGDTACRVYGFIGGLTGTVSICTLSAIALDRYNVVVYPLEPLRSVSGRRAKLSCLFVWVYGFTFSVIPALDVGLGTYVPEGYLTSCSFDYLSNNMNDKIFMMCFFVGAWIIPFSVITYSYTHILKVVLSAGDIKKNQTGSMSSRHVSEKDKRRTELKLSGVVMGVIGLWFVAWTPYAVVALLGIFGATSAINPLSSMIPALFCKTASCVDPFLYAVTHPRFRMELQDLFLTKEQKLRRRATKNSISRTDHNASRKIPRKRLERDFSEDGVEEIVVMVDVKENKIVGNMENDDEVNKTTEITSPKKSPCPKGLGLSTVKPLTDGVQEMMQSSLEKVTNNERVFTIRLEDDVPMKDMSKIGSKRNSLHRLSI